MNLHQNNSFVNRTRLPLLCEKSGAILLVLVGLMADGSLQSDEILVDFKNFLWIASLWCLTKVQCYQCISVGFLSKVY